MANINTDDIQQPLPAILLHLYWMLVYVRKIHDKILIHRCCIRTSSPNKDSLFMRRQPVVNNYILYNIKIKYISRNVALTVDNAKDRRNEDVLDNF